MAKKTKLNYRMLILLGIISVILLLCGGYLYFGGLEQSPEHFKEEAQKALEATPKNYAKAISAMQAAATRSEGTERLDYQYEVAKLLIERGLEEPNLRKVSREQYIKDGFYTLKGILRKDENHLRARKMLADHVWGQAVAFKQWELWREYIEHVNKLLELEDDPELYYRRGYARSWQGRQDSSMKPLAVDDFKKAIELDPKLVRYRIGLAIFYETDENPEESEKIYKQAMKDIPSSAELRIAYANFLRRQNRKTESLKVIQDSIECDKKDPSGYLALVEISLRDKDYKKADWALAQADKIDTGDQYIYQRCYYKSRIKKAQGDYEGSAQALRDGLKAIAERKVDVDNQPRFSIGKAKALLNYWLAMSVLDLYQREQDPEKKKKLLEEVRLCNRELIKISPEDPGQMKVSGRLAYADGKYQEAKRFLEEAIEASFDIQTAAILIDIYRRLNLPTRAEMLATKVLSIPEFKDHPYFLNQMVKSRIDIRDYRGARGYLDTVLRKNPDNEEAKILAKAIDVAEGKYSKDDEMTGLVRAMMLRRAEEFQMVEKYDDAAKILSDILAKNPTDMEAMGRLLQIYMDLGQKDKAVARLKKAIAENKNNELYKQWLALVEEPNQEKRFDLELKFADQIESSLGKAMYCYSICIRYGKAKQAQKYLEEAYAIGPNNPIVLELMMNQALANKDYKKAQETIAPLEQANKEMWYLLTAKIRIHENQIDDAIANLKSYLEGKSYSQVANLLLGDCYFSKGEYEKARDQYIKCLSNDAKDIKAMVGLAKVAMADNKIIEHDRWISKAYAYPEGKRNPYVYEQYVRLNVEPKNIDKAIDAREKKYKENPQNIANAYRLASLYEQQKNVSKAKAIYENIYAMVEDKIAFAEALADFYARHQMTTKSDELFNTLLASAKTDDEKIRTYIAYGNFVSQFDQAAAQSMYEKAQSIDSKDVRPMKVLANLFSAQAQQLASEGKTTESQLKWNAAIDKLRKVIELDPTDKQSRQALYRKYIDAGMLTDAAAGYRLMLQEDPEDVKAMIGLGLALLKQGEVDKAIAEFRVAIDKFPNMPDAYAFRAEAYKAKGELALAIEDLRKASQFSDNVLMKMDLAKLYIADENPQLAEATYNGIIGSPDTQNYYPAYVELVRLLLNSKRWQPLENLCQRGKETFPNSPLFYMAMAEMWDMRDNNNARIVELDRAVRLARNDYKVVQAYMMALYDAKHYKELGQVAAFYEQQPGFGTMSNAFKAMLLNVSNKPKEALNLMLVALKSSQNPANTMLVVKLMRKAFGDDRVIAESQAIINARPNDWVLLLALGNVAISNKKYSEAHKFLMEALNNVNNVGGRITILQSLAAMYESTKDYSAVEKAYVEILKVDPTNVVALNNLAYLYLRKDYNKPKKALPLIERAMQQRPGNQNLIDTYAWVLAQVGEYARAEGFLADILRRGSSSAEPLYHMAYVKEQLGDYSVAKDYYRRAKEFATDKNSQIYKDINEGILRVDAELSKKNQEEKK